MVINPKYISKNILNTLAHTESMYVHSVFNNGINLKAKDRLIYIGLKDGPSAIKVDKQYLPILNKCQVNDLVIVEDEKLKVKSVGLIVDYSKSNAKVYTLDKKDISSHSIEKMERIILGYNFMTGFDLSTADIVKKLNEDFGNDTELYLEYLIGRGRGLTPSGDDFLIGMLAYNNIRPFLSEEFFVKIKEKIRAEVTTDVSLNFLNDAVQGYFVQEIIELFDAIHNGRNFIAHIYNIANFGHTSGVDMLSGIVGAISLERKK